jgi:hypothetical protein
MTEWPRPKTASMHSFDVACRFRRDLPMLVLDEPTFFGAGLKESAAGDQSRFGD